MADVPGTNVIAPEDENVRFFGCHATLLLFGMDGCPREAPSVAVDDKQAMSSPQLSKVTGGLKTPVRAVGKLNDCGDGMESGSFDFVKSRKCIGFRQPSPDGSRVTGHGS